MGFAKGTIGLLEPESYEHEPGSTVDFNRLAVFDDGVDRLRVRVNLARGTELAGLWLKVSDDLAFEFGEPHNTDFSFDRRLFEWIFDLAEGSLGWSDGSDYEVSLWDKQPPGTSQPLQRLWSATLGADTDDYGGSLGNGVGFGASVSGTLEPQSYEYEQGATAEFRRLLLLPDGYDRLYVAVTAGAGAGMEGLWLRVSDHLAVRLGAPESLGSADRWIFDIGEGGLDWSSGNSYEVSLWDSRPPTLPRQLWSTTMTVGFEPYQTEGPGYGYANGGHGDLDDKTYEYEPGSTAEILRVVLFTDGADVVVLDATNLRELAGLWLRVDENLALELTTLPENAEEEYEWTITEGSLSWAADDEIEISLWDKDPTGG